MLETLSTLIAQAAAEQGGQLFSSMTSSIIMGIALVSGFYMAWSIGANDVANAMGTSVGSKALTLKQAIVVAGVLEFAGAFLVGRHVSETIRKGILPLDQLMQIPDGLQLYVYGMMGALLAAATWLMIATYFGLPVSTTHSIVGSVLGFGVVIFWGNLDMIAWGKVRDIIASWFVSPVMSGILSCAVFLIIQRTILFKKDMVSAAKRLAPVMVAIVFTIIALVTVYKGLKPLGLDKIEFSTALFISIPIGIVAALISIPLVNRVQAVPASGENDRELQNPLIQEELTKIRSRLKRVREVAYGDVEKRIDTWDSDVEALSRELEEATEANKSARQWGTPQIRATEKIFVYLQILSACTVAFAHGANDVANSIGPLSGVVSVLDRNVLEKASGLSTGWTLLLFSIGGVGIVAGLAMWGWRVIETIGKKITELTPTRGFSAEFGAAVTILVASRAGMPISTTHTLVGAVLGVGFARGIGALNLRVVRDIAVSWVVTLPAGALLAIIFFYIFKAIFS